MRRSAVQNKQSEHSPPELYDNFAIFIETLVFLFLFFFFIMNFFCSCDLFSGMTNTLENTVQVPFTGNFLLVNFFSQAYFLLF